MESKSREERLLYEKYTRANRKTLEIGSLISHYRIEELLGQGGYGDVYLVEDLEDGKRAALKTEYLEAPKKGLELELEILSSLDSPCFPHVYDRGATDTVLFFVMEQKGCSLSNYRRNVIRSTMKREHLLQTAIKTMELIEMFHETGYIHKDIKPSNYLFQRNQRYPIALIDFGLSRQHIDPETGRPFPFGKNHFTGTMKYASVNAHRGYALGRRDDLISWFYSMVELGSKHLPWSPIRDKEEVYEMKQSIDVRVLCRSVPRVFIRIFTYINSIKYEERPDYQMIITLLQQSCRVADFDWIAFYDETFCVTPVDAFNNRQKEAMRSKKQEDLEYRQIPIESVQLQTTYTNQAEKKCCQIF